MGENKEIDFDKLQEALEESVRVEEKAVTPDPAPMVQKSDPPEDEEPNPLPSGESTPSGEEELSMEDKAEAVAKALAAATITIDDGNERSEPRRPKVPQKELQKEPGPSITDRGRAVIENLGDYKKKIWALRKKKWFRLALIALAVLLLLFGVTQVVKYWTYSTYTVQTGLTGEDTTAASYSMVGDHVLKYSLDGAALLDSRGKSLWTSSYKMNAPQADSCENTAVIYDTQGTNMRVYQDAGEIGNITTDMPIVKAQVAKQGVVAAILESGENTWIQYYDTRGKSIASFKTTLDSPGYPLDIGLSPDGLLMAVTYLRVTGGVAESQIVFYNFSSVGQNQMDNMVNNYTLEGTIAPQVEYLDDSNCLVFREDGFTVYEGKQIPKQTAAVNLDKEIISTFYNSSYVGFIVRSDDPQNAFTLRLFSLKGKEMFSQDFDFDYDMVTMDEDQILMFNNKQICTYSVDGVKKFEGDIREGVMSNVLPLSSNRYLLVTEGGTCTIKLKK